VVKNYHWAGQMDPGQYTLVYFSDPSDPFPDVGSPIDLGVLTGSPRAIGAITTDVSLDITPYLLKDHWYQISPTGSEILITVCVTKDLLVRFGMVPVPLQHR